MGREYPVPKWRRRLPKRRVGPGSMPDVVANEHRWQIGQQGRDVGYVSAAAFSPRLDSNIAVGMVSVEAMQTEARFDVHCEDCVRSGIAVDLPLI